MKKELLVGLLRGETWTVSQAENEFAPVAPRDVRSEVEDLLQAGVIRSIDGQLKLGSEAEETPNPQAIVLLTLSQRFLRSVPILRPFTGLYLQLRVPW